MTSNIWTWNPQEHPRVLLALDVSPTDNEWCYRLEDSAEDAVVGKVLCVCASLLIAQTVTSAEKESGIINTEALKVLEEWIDIPTEERFQEICSKIFNDDNAQSPNLHPVCWWALRTATASVGNLEAGWALSSTCSASFAAGFEYQLLQDISRNAVLNRQRPIEP